MKRLLSILLIALPIMAMAQEKNTSDNKVVILYENDPHSTLEGYAKMVSLKANLLESTPDVLTVSGGDFSADFFPGDKLGNRSRGAGIIKLMNKVGYDFVVPGNHDFDYSIQNIKDNFSNLTAKALCCNCIDLQSKEPIFPGYAVHSIGGIKIGFVGVTTPKTVSRQLMKYFADADGNMLYSFCEDNLYELVQQNVNEARSEGADYVVVLSHLGNKENGSVTSLNLIANTTGIDVVLDAHAHSVIPEMRLENMEGKQVILSSTGLKFANLGVLTIEADGTIDTELVSTEGIVPDAKMLEYIEDVDQQSKVAPGYLLDKTAFETEIDGKQVSLYTITNGIISAQITNFGGYITGIYAPDKNGNYTNVVGHNDNIEQYKGFSRNPCGSALGRFANRIGNATFTLDGITYELTKNNGQHILHSGKQGFGNIVWDVEEVKSDKLVLSCLSKDGTDGFPGNVKTYLTFSITEDNGVQLTYEATTDKATVINMSHHAYFNLDGFSDSNILDFILTINADSITEADPTNIPTGKFINVEGTPYDFRDGVRLGERQFASPAVRPAPGTPMPEVPEGMVRSYDINFVLNHIKAGEVEKVASLYSPKSGRLMEVFNNHPGMQLFTGNRAAIAMESQMFPDSPNHPEFPSTVLRPGETYKHTIIYRFSVK